MSKKLTKAEAALAGEGFIPNCSVPGCPEKAHYPELQLCRRHYQRGQYKLRLTKAMKFDPAVAVNSISKCLKEFKIQRDGGLLDILEFGYLQRLFLGKQEHLIRLIKNDLETNEAIEGDELYVEDMLKDDPHLNAHLLRQAEGLKELQTPPKEKEEEPGEDTGEEVVQ